VALGGDNVAQGIFQRAGRELGQNAAAIIRKLGMESERFTVVLAGGVLVSRYSVLTNALEAEVGRVAPRAQFVVLPCPPVVGAVLMAFDALGKPLSESARRRLVATSGAARPERV
jgi:hypothetical protein